MEENTSKQNHKLELYQIFLKNYNDLQKSNSDDINLFETIHIGENDHTNILRDILKFKQNDKSPFLESFCKVVLGIKKPQEYEVLVQQPAIAYNNSAKNRENKGFIDMVLQSNEQIVIIESKACEASDGDFQLARYYYSYVRTKDENDWPVSKFSNNYRKWWDKKKKKEELKEPSVMLVYLTKDETSPLPKDLYDCSSLSWGVEPTKISYEVNILPWLQNEVLPNIPYLEGGEFISGVRMYIQYLKNSYLAETTKNNKVFDNIAQNIYKKEIPEIQQLYNYYVSSKPEKIDEKSWNDYKNFLKYLIGIKVQQFVKNSVWNIHINASIFQIYKKDWERQDLGIHFELRTNYQKKNKWNWELHFESKRLYEQYKKLLLENKNLGYIDKNNNTWIWKKDSIEIKPQGDVNKVLLDRSDDDIKNYISQVLDKISEFNEEISGIINKLNHI